jgi:ATP-binding cassette, subfamily G (WHITE), member 1
MLIMMVHVTFAGVLVLEKDAQPWLRWIFDLNFMKHGNDGLILAIFGFNRDKLECEEMYCHFRNPETFLKMIGAQDTLKVFYMFPIVFLVMHIWTYINMNNRLKHAN